jgi:hypothetical protein
VSRSIRSFWRTMVRSAMPSRIPSLATRLTGAPMFHMDDLELLRSPSVSAQPSSCSASASVPSTTNACDLSSPIIR